MIILLSYLITILLLICLILLLTYCINVKAYSYEKDSAYECGFEPFSDARSFFDAHFYLVGLLFIVFDLEVVFLIPFVVNIEYTTIQEYVGFLLFMSILIIGFVYEWCSGLLNWVPHRVYFDQN